MADDSAAVGAVTARLSLSLGPEWSHPQSAPGAGTEVRWWLVNRPGICPPGGFSEISLSGRLRSRAVALDEPSDWSALA
jgi:hypothetical protein